MRPALLHVLRLSPLTMRGFSIFPDQNRLAVALHVFATMVRCTLVGAISISWMMMIGCKQVLWPCWWRHSMRTPALGWLLAW